MSDRPDLELIVLCGALGSGKTTLLGQFLAQRDLRDTAVIVNEAGSVGIDAAVLQAASPDDPVLLLDNGCVCCSLRSSLVQTLLDLLHQPRPSDFPPLARVVIETSGISRPGPLLASLRDRDLVQFAPRIRVVCTFDAASIAAAVVDEEDHLAQWAAAHRIVITRTDLAGALSLQQAQVRAHALNPLAEVIASADRQARSDAAFARSPTPSADASPSIDPAWFEGLSSGHPRLVVMQGAPDTVLNWAAFAGWVDDLAGLLGERMLRFKAVLALADQPSPMLLQAVGTTFSAPVPAQGIFERMGQRASIIVIARDVSAQAIADELPDAPVRLQTVSPGSGIRTAATDFGYRAGRSA